ncbi:MAG TPA: ABC-three component system protein [Allosphingosinicella sp.]|nr:ABC-three component system protein [Allosphingosinicella sp.]
MNIQIKRAKHAAPGQYLGFGLQPVRAFFHLLTCPRGAMISLEHLDDVAIHYADGSLCLEQTKSALKQNPISDWADDLWKAIDNWLEMVKSGACKAGETRFRLYVTPPKTGAFAGSLHAATTSADVAALVDTIKTRLAKLKDRPGCLDHLQPFLDASAEQQIAIVAHLVVESDAADPVDALRALLTPMVHPEHIDLLCKAGIGLAKQDFDRLIQRGLAPVLDGDAFKHTYGAFLRRNLMPGLLTSLAPVPGDAELATIVSMRPTFIRQLEFIEVSGDDTLRAVSDYLRTSADKADWAERGLIFPGSLDDWDDSLIHRHSLVCGDITDLHGDKSPIVQGRLAYRQCASHQAPLEGRSVPSHFVHGSFNDLADRRRLGWHPHYETLLGGGEG